MRQSEFCKIYDVSRDKVKKDAELGLIDIQKIREGGRAYIEIIENEKLLDYEPRNNRRPPRNLIKVKNNPAWTYRNDLMGIECSAS